MTKKTNTHAHADEPRLYEYVWRNKWLTAKAESIDDMIGSLQDAADELRKMKARGVTLDQNGGVEDDYATLITDDPSVAEEFGFDDPDEDDDEGTMSNSERNKVTRAPLAERMLAYVRERAKTEGVGFELDVGFFESAIRQGVNPIFGVFHDGERMFRDLQEPHEGYFNGHAPNG